MARVVLALSVAMLAAGAVAAGNRPERSTDATSFVFFSGGVPALEFKSYPDNPVCPFEIKQPTRSKPAKAVFAVY